MATVIAASEVRDIITELYDIVSVIVTGRDSSVGTITKILAHWT